jgi:hypothetical protein
MSNSSIPSRTPTLASNRSMSNIKPTPSDQSHDVVTFRRGSDHSSVPTEKEKAVTGATATGKPAGLQQGMVAPLQLSRWRFWAIFISLMISIFLFALGKSSHHLMMSVLIGRRPTYSGYCNPEDYGSLQFSHRAFLASFWVLVSLSVLSVSADQADM